MKPATERLMKSIATLREAIGNTKPFTRGELISIGIAAAKKSTWDNISEGEGTSDIRFAHAIGESTEGLTKMLEGVGKNRVKTLHQKMLDEIEEFFK